MALAMTRWMTCFFIALMSCAQAQENCAPVTLAKGAITDYRPVNEYCHLPQGGTRVVMRRFQHEDRQMVLAVDGQTLATALLPAACLVCDPVAGPEPDMRFARARSADVTFPAKASFSDNAGLHHGTGDGSFLTLDLCPSPKPLDRSFLKQLAEEHSGLPLAFAVAGSWLKRHEADFNWLLAEQSAGAFAITWVNHSYSHAFTPGLPNAQNFLLKAGTNFEREVLETEKLLILKGATPSVFFRFPGLVSDKAMLDRLKSLNLIALGADAWLAKGARPQAGAIILLHANGNEPFGLSQFNRLAQKNALPLPFRPLVEAP